ncbi:MAG: VOC family protein [Candidatus Moraniibacteriota bacterium]
MQKIVPCLWVEKDAGAVAEFYAGIFKDAKVKSVQNNQKGPGGEFSTAAMELFGQEFQILAAGLLFKFTEAVSFVINCDDQTEIDYYYAKLSTVPGTEQCGWLKDKFGLSWQIVPTVLSRFLSDPDWERVARVNAVLYQMKKLNLAALERAYTGGDV